MNSKQYFDELGAFARDCVDQLAQKPDMPFDAGEFVNAILVKMPPPARVTLDEAESAVADDAERHFRVIGESQMAHADLLERLNHLGHAAGCPSGEPLIPWLQRRGLIRVEGQRVEFLTPGPREARH